MYDWGVMLEADYGSKIMEEEFLVCGVRILETVTPLWSMTVMIRGL